MIKVGIVTINDNDNYGNRLQNYAVQKYLENINVQGITLINKQILNDKHKFLLRKFKIFIKGNKKTKSQRNIEFERFNENIKFSERIVTPFSKISKEYDYFIVGSDQVWNPKIGRMRDVDLLNFAKNRQKISFSASFAINKLPDESKEKARKALRTFKAISVREEAGKKIIEDVVGRKDVEVLVDPTMLLNATEWDKVAKKPEQLKTDKYILNYFLGELSEERKKEIDRIAKENNCEVINILDKNSSFYSTGPSEFLYLEKHAFLICTDSFHSSVFAILYNRPFVVFEREDNTRMNSRLDTLLKKFNLKRQVFDTVFKEEQLQVDYTEAYKILDEERKKSEDFLKRALDLK